MRPLHCVCFCAACALLCLPQTGCFIPDPDNNTTTTTTASQTSTTTTVDGILYTLESIYENMVSIAGGTFEMGCSPEDAECAGDELPQHTVTVSPFRISAFEVSQGQWETVMGTNPSSAATCGTDCPVENVSRNDVFEFIETLNAATGKNYRLCTEAEWEYAVRSGTKTSYYCGGSESCLTEIAWYFEESGSELPNTHEAGLKEPNAWGLYDMSGNVWEMVQDCYHTSYEAAPDNGSAWELDCYEEGGIVYVTRGGSWLSEARFCRSSARGRNSADGAYNALGFRLCLTE